MNPYAPPQQPPAYPPPGYPPAAPPGADPQQARSRLMVPGIIIAVLAGILVCVFALDLVMAATGGLAKGLSTGTALDETATTGLLIGVCVFAMAANAFVIFAMIQMVRTRTWVVALIGCIISALPLTSSACCLLTLPFAIWAIVVLLKPEVKAAFT